MTPGAPSVEPGGRGSLHNALAVLAALRDGDPDGLGVAELSRATGLHKSTVSRVLGVLAEDEIVTRDDSRRARLGLGLVRLAAPALRRLDARAAARPALAALREATGETAALMLWHQGAAMCVEQDESQRAIKHTMPWGARFTSAFSASVQVFLAELAPEELSFGLASGLWDLDTRRPSTLHEALERGRREQVFVNDRRTAEDEVGIAAGIRDLEGRVCAAVLLAAPAHRLPSDLLGPAAQATRAAAQRVSAALAHVPEAGRSGARPLTSRAGRTSRSPGATSPSRP